MDWFSDKPNKTRISFPCRKGMNNSNAKITQETADEIKFLLRNNQGQTEISKKLKVSYQIVSNIKRGLAWKS